MKLQTTIPRRYELGERLIYVALALLTIIGLAASFGCAGTYEDGEETGTAKQGLGSKFSPGFTYGVAQADLTNCTISPGGNPCVLPGRTTIRYKFDGADECLSLSADESWQYQIQRGLEDIHANSGGFGMPFSLVADSVNPSVIFKRGSCPLSPLGTSMGAFVCVKSWPSTVPVTASLFGTYVRNDNPLTVTIDVDDIRVTPTIPGTCSSGGTRELHDLLEHMGHIAGAIPYGQGMYPSHKGSCPTCLPYWLTPEIAPNTASTFQRRFDTEVYPPGALCRIGSWSSGPITSDFVKKAGSCVD